MTEVVAIRHVSFEDLGFFEQVLKERGIDVTYVDAGQGRIRERVERHSPQLLVILGGPIGAGDTAQYPFLEEEMALIRARSSRDRPLLGICLGAQLIAAALGARVYPAREKEIGWREVELSEAGAASPLAELSTPVLHWHGDTFDLPVGAVHLASTEVCRNQAFAVGRRTLGLQFHAEVPGAAIESWLIGHSYEISQSPGISVNEIRARTLEHACQLEREGRKFFGRWLDEALA
ncbi:glutamine amidotransferase [Streptomyces purpurogeneiscleroticus]|uniref:glutamine amidotransferase n=1 Tax=Streptomyces purpurogeneiscleroticus TaxID=68259 RepID=UPI001CBCA35C|nr:glutamine amidotransferase [Streptomyces purpurogeneiscleroticus]MBZ4018697.1 glutamine amidotransferase [Streptomyces purpurogeneiscleroticus]